MSSDPEIRAHLEALKRFSHLQRTRSLRAKGLMQRKPVDRRRVKRAMRLRRLVDAAYRARAEIAVERARTSLADLGRVLNRATSASENLLGAFRRVTTLEGMAAAWPTPGKTTCGSATIMETPDGGRVAYLPTGQAIPLRAPTEPVVTDPPWDRQPKSTTVRISEPVVWRAEEVKELMLAELRRELNACPATPAGYREAARIGAQIVRLRGDA